MPDRDLPAKPSGVVPYGPPEGTEIEVILRYGAIEFQVTKGRVLSVGLDLELDQRKLNPHASWAENFEASRIERLTVIVERTD